MKSIEHSTQAQAANAMEALGVPEDDVSEPEKLIDAGYGDAGFLLTRHLLPHEIEVHKNPRSLIALRAMSDVRDKYSDIHVRALIDNRMMGKVAQPLMTRVLEELVQQAAINGATKLITKLHVPGPTENPEVVMAIWDNGNPYPDAQSLQSAYLDDPMHDLTAGSKIIKRSNNIDMSRYPTLAVLHTALVFNGTFTAASNATAMDVAKAPDSSQLSVSDREIDPIDGNIVVVSIPYHESYNPKR